MPDSFKFEIQGAEEVLSRLRTVSFETRKKTGRGALLKAAQLVAIAAADKWRQLDDKKTGQSIADNIAYQGVTPKGRSTTRYPGIRWASNLHRRTGNLGFRIGVAGTARTSKENVQDKSKGAPTPHWRLLEFGTEAIPAKSIMQNALRNNTDAATQTFVSEYIKKLDSAIKRAK